MQPIEIIVIATSIAIVGFVIGRWIYRKVKHMRTGDCECCKLADKNNFLKEYRKKYGGDKAER